MSRIDDLITQYAPDGVEYAALSDIATTVAGLSGKTKADFADGNARFVSYKNVFANLSVDQEAPDFVRVAEGERQNELQFGDVIFTGSSESVEEVGMSSVVLEQPIEALYLNSFCFAVRFVRSDLLEPSFSKHLFRSDGVRRQIQESASGVTRINVSKPRFMKTRIPVPPIEVQREIVRILDAFTGLEAELETELALRDEQYAAMSQRLFMEANAGFHGGPVERIRIGALANQSFRPESLDPGVRYDCLGVKWYGAGAYLRVSRLGSEIKAKSLNRVCAGQFLYNRMFVTEGSFAIVGRDLDGGLVSNEFPVYDLDETRIEPGWLLLSLLDEFALKRIEAETTGVERGSMKSRRRWKEDRFEAFVIDLPPLAVQRSVLERLRAFQDLREAISEELAARRLQSGYYRDRLLSFEEATT